jgi:hypothetical protein
MRREDGVADDAPKSAYQLAMERLRRQDQEAGIEEKPVSEEQKAEIAEIRRLYGAKLAEREIFHDASLRKTRDPAERETLEKEYRREREQVLSEQDRKIDEVRQRLPANR